MNHAGTSSESTKMTSPSLLGGFTNPKYELVFYL